MNFLSPIDFKPAGLGLGYTIVNCLYHALIAYISISILFLFIYIFILYRFSVSPNRLLPSKILETLPYTPQPALNVECDRSSSKSAISYKPRASPESRKAVLQRKVPMVATSSGSLD